MPQLCSHHTIVIPFTPLFSISLTIGRINGSDLKNKERMKKIEESSQMIKLKKLQFLRDNPSRYHVPIQRRFNWITYSTSGARRLVSSEESSFEKKNKEGKKKKKKRENSNGNVIKTCTTNDAFLSSSLDSPRGRILRGGNEREFSRKLLFVHPRRECFEISLGSGEKKRRGGKKRKGRSEKASIRRHKARDAYSWEACFELVCIVSQRPSHDSFILHGEHLILDTLRGSRTN